MNLVNEGVLPPNEPDERDERREEREMAQERETLADIVAEYRSDADAMDRGDLYQPTTEYVRRLLDRIDAAWKREHSAWKDLNDIACEMLKHEKDDANRRVEEVSRQVGNAAATREALCEIVLLILKVGRTIRADVACGIIASKAKHALSAPARNCDRFTSIEEARTAYCSECGRLISIWDEDESWLFEEWLFATAAERKGEGDEQK